MDTPCSPEWRKAVNAHMEHYMPTRMHAGTHAGTHTHTHTFTVFLISHSGDTQGDAPIFFTFLFLLCVCVCGCGCVCVCVCVGWGGPPADILHSRWEKAQHRHVNQPLRLLSLSTAHKDPQALVRYSDTLQYTLMLYFRHAFMHLCIYAMWMPLKGELIVKVILHNNNMYCTSFQV